MMHIWGMEPIYFIMFAILISFAAFAVILEKNGFVASDEESNESPVTAHILWQGSGIALMCGCVSYIANTAAMAQ